MDVSLPPGNTNLICDLCGYPRQGLARESLCPECGAPPPQLVATAGSQSRSLEELRWLRTLAVGVWLLILTSAAALQVALIMPIGEWSIGAINYPGPKLFASALVQRAIGGNPGPWGVYGTLIVMLSGLALYLLTEACVVESHDESAFSLRRRTRWIGLLSLGGFGGLLLSGFDPTINYSSTLSINLFAIGVTCCELPANTLIYLYLRALARRLGDRRAIKGLGICVIGVPVLTSIGVVMLVLGTTAQAEFATLWRLSIMAYGAAALAVGVIGTTCVLRLSWVLTVAAFEGWLLSVRQAVVRSPLMLRRAIALVDDQLPHWSVVIGLILFLGSLPLCVEDALNIPTRFGLGGDVPLLNFVGPKISAFSLVRAAAARFDRDNDEAAIAAGELGADGLTILALWLMTVSIPELDPSPKWRWAVRYGILAMLSASIGAVLSISKISSVGPSHFTAWAVLTIEAPATCMLYFYLATLATGLNDGFLARRFRLIALAAVAMAVAPLPLLVLSRRLHPWRRSWSAAGFGAVFVVLSLCLSLTACGAVARLAYRIARSAIDRRPQNPKSAGI